MVTRMRGSRGLTVSGAAWSRHSALSPPRVAVAWAVHSVEGRAGKPRGFLGPGDAMVRGRI